MDRVIELSIHDANVQKVSQADPRIVELIPIIRDITIPLRNDPFMALTHSVIGQQLSVKAAGTIYARVEALCHEVTPQSKVNSLVPLLHDCFPISMGGGQSGICRQI